MHTLSLRASRLSSIPRWKATGLGAEECSFIHFTGENSAKRQVLGIQQQHWAQVGIIRVPHRYALENTTFAFLRSSLKLSIICVYIYVFLLSRESQQTFIML